MRHLLALLLLLAAPVAAAQYHIENSESCEAADVLTAEEDGKLWCRRPIQFEAVDITADCWCREPDCSVTLADNTIEWDWPETTEIEWPEAGDPIESLSFREIVGPKTGFLLHLDGSWQLVVNGEPYVCTPEEDRR